MTAEKTEGVEILSYKIFKEIILNYKGPLPKFTSYVRGSATTLANSGLLGFITILGKKYVRGPKEGQDSYLLLLISVMKFLKDSGEISMEVDVNKIVKMKNNKKAVKEKFIFPAIEEIARINEDLERRSRVSDLLMEFLIWMKSFSEAML